MIYQSWTKNPMLICALGLGIFLQPIQALAQGKTLGDVVATALKNSPVVEEAREKVSEARSSRVATLSGLAPSVTGTLGAQYKKDASSSSGALFGGQPYNAYAFGFQVVQPIFAGEALWRRYMVANDEIGIREQNLAIAERDLKMQAVRLFFQLLLAQARVDQLKQTEAIYEDLEEFAQKRIRLKLGQDLELLQIQTRRALLLPRLERAKSDLALAATDLSTLIREEQGGEIRIRGSLDGPDWKNLIEEEKKQDSDRPELRRIGTMIEQAENRRAVQMATHWPQVSATADWGRSALRAVDLADGATTSWSIGIQLSVPLFTGFSSFFDRAALSAQVSQVEAQKALLMDQLYMERQRAERELELSKLVVDASAKALKLARKSFEFAQSQHRVGRIEFIRLSDVQESLLEAEVSYDQARHDRVIAVGNYLISRGGNIQRFIDALN